jgi:uncharacterized membrane protein YfcA
MSSGEIAMTLAVLLLASAVQATAGFGFALLSMPLLSAIIGPPSALAITSMLSIVNSGTTALTARAHADRTALRRLVVAAIVGMPFGLLLLESVSERAMQIVISVTVAAFALVLARGVRFRNVDPKVEVGAGVLSGALATSTGTSGPPIVICLQSRGLPAAQLRATVSSQFLATGWISVLLLALRGHIDDEDVLVALVAVPVMFLSWAIGAHSFARLSQSRYELLVVSLLLTSAGVGIIRAAT